MRSLALALVVASFPVLAGEDHPVAFGVPPSPYLQIVDVGCAAPSNGKLVYVWHNKLPGIDEVESMRVFKHLQSPLFEGCLSTIARTKPGLYEALLKLGPESDPETRATTIRRARSAWVEYGADVAMEEVAKANTLGPYANRFFERCAELEKAPPKREERPPRNEAVEVRKAGP